MLKNKNNKGFSLMELIIVIAIIGVLSGAAYIGIQKVQSRNMNDKVLDDLIAISNAMEQFKRDHPFSKYPIPTDGGNMNLNCFYADATYAHDCTHESTAFIQGMLDNNLLTRRYLQEVPTDPRTSSRYVYGVSRDGQYFQVAGNFLEKDGTWVAKTVGNLSKGHNLPSLIRSYNGPNFVIEDGSNLPYSPDHLIISAVLRNVKNPSQITVTDANDNTVTIEPDMVVYSGYRVLTEGTSVDIYYADGSISTLDDNSEMEILSNSSVEQNDADGIITKIRVKLFSGKIWNKVARLASKSEFNIQTTSAIAGVRGTEFGIVCEESTGECDSTHLIISTGKVAAKARPDGTTPGEVVVINKETSFVEGDVAEGDTTPADGIDKVVYKKVEDNTDTVSDIDTLEKILATDLPAGSLKDYVEEIVVMEKTILLNNNIVPRIKEIIGEDKTIILYDKDALSRTTPIEKTVLADKIIFEDEDGNVVLDKELSEAVGNLHEVVLTSGEWNTIKSTGKVVIKYYDSVNELESGAVKAVFKLKDSTFLTEEEIYGGESDYDYGVSALDCGLDLTYPTAQFSVQPEVLNWYLKPDGCEALITSYTVTIGSDTFENINPVSIAFPHNAYMFNLSDNSIVLDYGTYEWTVEAIGTVTLSETTSFEIVDTTTECITGHVFVEDCSGDASADPNGTSIKTFVCNEDGAYPTNAECVLTNCNIGYEMDGDSCITCTTTVPDNAYYASQCSDWVCDDGYELDSTETECVSNCGDGLVVGVEECDGGTGCSTCTCDSEYIANVPVGVDCVEPLITLTTPAPPTTIAIDSDLTWVVSPTYAFDGAVYSLTIDSTNVTGNTNTFLSLAGITSPTITSGSTYTWQVKAFNGTTPIAVSYEGSFKIEEAAPVISGLGIDCTTCGTGENYTVSFEVTNATSCTASSEVLPPGGGSPGVLGIVQLISEYGSFTFDTAGVSATVDIQITVTCTGPGGNNTDSFNVYMEY